jgi:hypothetical protein
MAQLRRRGIIGPFGQDPGPGLTARCLVASDDSRVEDGDTGCCGGIEAEQREQGGLDGSVERPEWCGRQGSSAGGSGGRREGRIEGGNHGGVEAVAGDSDEEKVGAARRHTHAVASFQILAGEPCLGGWRASGLANWTMCAQVGSWRVVRRRVGAGERCTPGYGQTCR